MTNSTKAAIIGFVNAAIGLAVVLGVNITSEQTGAILVFANAALAVAAIATRKLSPRWKHEA